MSVEFGKPHAVDVPVVDLDDPEDDILFHENQGHEFMESMDFEDPQPTGMFSKIRAYFNSRPTTSYEFVGRSNTRDSGSDFFDVSGDENSENIELRDYKIKRLNQKLNKTILLFAAAIVFLLGILFLSRGSPKDENTPVETNILLSNSTHNFHKTTVLVSLDGFHPHYINPQNTPALHGMMMDDYGAPYMVPSFPSSTFPNHWSIITGLYPSEHGIVGNTFYDPKLKKQFINTDPKFGLNPQFWKGGEPLWTTAQKQGLKSAVHMWPGSEVPNIGKGLEIDKYNGSELLSSKVDRVMGWLDRKIETRPELILAYVPTIDQYGHKFGISGSNLTEALRYVDDFVALMIAELRARNLEAIVNLVVVSDHGMAPTSNDRLLFLDDIVSMDKIEHVDGWPLFGLRPYAEYSTDVIMAEINEKLEKLDDETKNSFTAYRVEDIPKEWNFGGKLEDHRFNYRLAPIWLIPKVGYSITTHKKFEENNNDYYPKGVHGYNNTELLMRAIFLGRGPYFKEKLAENKKVLPFANTEVYNLICDTLGIQPSPNNGSAASTDDFAVSSTNILPPDWRDELVYPDLPFKVDHVVKDATYDLLWRKPAERTKPTTISVSSNQHPLESLLSEESSILGLTLSLPKPTDYSGDSEPTAEADSGDSDKQDGDGKEQGLDLLWDHLGEVAGDVESVVEDVVDEAVGFFGSLFGGGNDN